MKQTHRAFKPVRSLLAAALAFAALPAAAQTYTQTVFFGDSLTDSGWNRPALVQIGGPAAAITGKFTTNPTLVWSEYAGRLLRHQCGQRQPGRHQLGRRRRAHGHRRRKRAGRDPVAQHADQPLSDRHRRRRRFARAVHGVGRRERPVRDRRRRARAGDDGPGRRCAGRQRRRADRRRREVHPRADRAGSRRDARVPRAGPGRRRPVARSCRRPTTTRCSRRCRRRACASSRSIRSTCCGKSSPRRRPTVSPTPPAPRASRRSPRTSLTCNPGTLRVAGCRD